MLCRVPLEQEPLRVEGRHAFRGGGACVTTIRAQRPRAIGVAQQHFQYCIAKQLTQRGIVHRAEDRDAAIEVARQQIGAAEGELGRAAVLEVVDARVAEELADDRADVDPIADPGMPGRKQQTPRTSRRS